MNTIDVVLDELAQRLATQVEAEVHGHGWDGPSTMWHVRFEDVPDGAGQELASALASGAIEAETVIHGQITSGGTASDRAGDRVLAEGLDQMVLALGLEFVDVLDGHPFDALVGRYAPADVVGVVVTTEGWQYPDEVLDAMVTGWVPELPRSEHPDRVSVRHVNVLFRTGQAATAVRNSSHDGPTIEACASTDGPAMAGFRIPEAMRRYLGAVSHSQLDMPAREAARWAWLAQTLAMAEKHDAARAMFAGQGMDPDVRAAVDAHPSLSIVVAAAFNPGPVLQSSLDFGGLAALVTGAGRVGGTITDDPALDPLPGSEADLADWEVAHQAHIAYLQDVPAALETAAAETRKLGSTPLWMVKEDIASRLRFARWADARMWGAETCQPDRAAILTALVELVEDEVIEPGAGAVALEAAGVRGAPVDTVRELLAVRLEADGPL